MIHSAPCLFIYISIYIYVKKKRFTCCWLCEFVCKKLIKQHETCHVAVDFSVGYTGITLVSAKAFSFVEVPVVERLQLSELIVSSVEEQDESVDEDELQKFKELKQKMILLDKAELVSLTEGDRNLKSHPFPVIKR